MTVKPKDVAAVEDMSMDMLKQEIKKDLEEVANREEVFVIIIDATNQVIERCFLSICIEFTSVCWCE